MPHSVAPTPGLKVQPAKQVDLDVDISVAVANLQRTHPGLLIEPNESKVTSGKQFRTRTINGEVCLLGKRHGAVAVKTKEGWRGLEEYVAEQQPRLRKRDLLRTAWTARRKDGVSSTPGRDLGKTNVRSPEVLATLRRTASPPVLASSPAEVSMTHSQSDHSAMSEESSNTASTSSSVKLRASLRAAKEGTQQSPWRSRVYPSDDAELVALRRQQEDARARQQALLASMMKTNSEMVALLGVAD